MTLEEDARVAKLIDYENMTWREDVIRQIFYNFEAEEILAIPLPRSWQEDVFCWQGMRDRKYNVKIAYHLSQLMIATCQRVIVDNKQIEMSCGARSGKPKSHPRLEYSYVDLCMTYCQLETTWKGKILHASSYVRDATESLRLHPMQSLHTSR